MRFAIKQRKVPSPPVQPKKIHRTGSNQGGDISVLSRDPLKDHCTDEVLPIGVIYSKDGYPSPLARSMLLGAGRTTRIHRSIIRRVLYCIKNWDEGE